jgi:hypothetical protein
VVEIASIPDPVASGQCSAGLLAPCVRRAAAELEKSLAEPPHYAKFALTCRECGKRDRV